MPSLGLGLSVVNQCVVSGGSGGPPSLPSGLIAAWAVLPGQYTKSGSTITGMTDISGNGNHITSLPTPPLEVSLLGDTYFDFASSKYMTIPASVSCNQQNCAVFVVGQQGTGTTGSVRAASLGDGLNMGIGWTGDSTPSGELSRGTNLSAGASNKIWTGFGWQLHGRVNTASESRFWLDLENKATSAASSATVTGGEIGRNPFSGTGFWNGYWKATFVFSPAPDSTQLAAMRNYCQYYFKVGSSVSDSCFVVDGDSITAGGVGGALPWANFMGSEAVYGQNNIRPKWRSYATGGHTVAQVLAGVANPIAWLSDMTYYTNKHYIVMCGVNSLGTVSEGDIETDMAAIVTAVQAAGAVVTFLTILPSTTLSGSEETKRQNINSWIISGGSGADNVVDLRSVTGLTDASDTTYFSDGVHPTSAGEKIIGDIVFSQLFPS